MQKFKSLARYDIMEYHNDHLYYCGYYEAMLRRLDKIKQQHLYRAAVLIKDILLLSDFDWDIDLGTSFFNRVYTALLHMTHNPDTGCHNMPATRIVMNLIIKIMLRTDGYDRYATDKLY